MEAHVNCPNCGHDLPESAERCPACNAELTWEADDAEPEVELAELVTVLETADPTLIPVVRSLLEAEGIPCTVEFERMQDLIGGGRMGTGYNVILGPTHLQVAPEDVEAARALIEHHVASMENEPAN
jgi:predicted ATP-dependent serine protease